AGGVPPVSITVLVSISRRKAVVLTVLVELFNNAASMALSGISLSTAAAPLAVNVLVILVAERMFNALKFHQLFGLCSNNNIPPVFRWWFHARQPIMEAIIAINIIWKLI
ncbi:hypothetical protein HY772_03475, partial [Candidatus Woesearchaeota archaeon]|nr:hypothetical protein [Candidatus Woesearchaeota archaeon]